MRGNFITESDAEEKYPENAASKRAGMVGIPYERPGEEHFQVQTESPDGQVGAASGRHVTAGRV